MTSKALWVLAAVAFCFSAQSAFADDWTCSYVGAWTTDGSENKGDFNWKVKWEKSEDGWHVIGDYTDRYGASYLDGNCAEKHCVLTQTYNSGDLNGSVYTWTGDYTDAVDSPTQTTNAFTGTWTATKGNSGAWTASAVCTKN